MRKTLLLCFIHGFKGGDDTFGTFPEHLRALIGHALPNITVTAVTYPKFETRGDLHNCVARFREWLQNVVIDLEVSAGTPSPTVDPSVRVILCGHSMGGIVAAETFLSITSDDPVPASSAAPIDSSSHVQSLQLSTDTARPASPPSSFMFPYIQGILAFDTPYLGISPGVVAHGAESHYKAAASAYSAVTELASVFGYGAANSTDKETHSKQKPRALPAGPEAAKEAMAASMTASTADAAATPVWQRWGKYAMFAGAAGAVAAGGAAAYLKRDTITEGWSWVGSHLEFVGCLMRSQELQERLEKMGKTRKEKGVGFKNLITVLGKGANGVGDIGAAPKERTFCVVPRKGRDFEKSVNEKAKDEIGAHQSMFWPKENPGFFALVERSKTLVAGWVDEGWYGSSDEGGLDITEDVGLNDEEVEMKEGSDNEGLGGSVIVG